MRGAACTPGAGQTLVVVTVRIYEKLKRLMQRIDDACAGYELDPVAPAA